MAPTKEEILEALKQVYDPEILEAIRVEFAWDAPWRPETMSAEAKQQLGWR